MQLGGLPMPDIGINPHDHRSRALIRWVDQKKYCTADRHLI
jgi:hypothetical protein